MPHGRKQGETFKNAQHLSSARPTCDLSVMGFDANRKGFDTEGDWISRVCTKGIEGNLDGLISFFFLPYLYGRIGLYMSHEFALLVLLILKPIQQNLNGLNHVDRNIFHIYMFYSIVYYFLYEQCLVFNKFYVVCVEKNLNRGYFMPQTGHIVEMQV